ncbi:hypothetical protein DSO57_1032140 [Entomophthora muscae]|uniref:Uncharacterized protein n=1 Tax=Entomophthora muscae TaxID=34485 RepID=A0ACC2RRI2_9FUNG|nr:hypothetical protein DSO57_1032140 [Entomophthora muscae]
MEEIKASPNPFSDDSSDQIRQAAVDVLTQYSELAAHALHNNESTARTQLRMLRFLVDAAPPAPAPILSTRIQNKQRHHTYSREPIEFDSMDYC